MPTRLTEAQQKLLDEIRNSATGGLLIRDFSRYSKTAAALVRHDLVSKKWEYDNWYWYEPVPEQSPGEQQPTDAVTGEQHHPEPDDTLD